MPGLLYYAPDQPAAGWREVDLLSYWAACVECSGDKDADRRALVAAVTAERPHIERALRGSAGAFGDVLDAGLARRDGLFLRGFDGEVYRWLRDRCPDHRPEHISVCEHCARVFRHNRNRYRYKCDACQASPRARPALWSVDDGKAVFAGPDGKTWARLHECEYCGEAFIARRADNRFCPGTDHQKRAKRGTPLRDEFPLERQQQIDQALIDYEQRMESDRKRERADPEFAAARREEYEELRAMMQAREQEAADAFPRQLAELFVAMRSHLAEHGLYDRD